MNTSLGFSSHLLYWLLPSSLLLQPFACSPDYWNSLHIGGETQPPISPPPPNYPPQQLIESSQKHRSDPPPMKTLQWLPTI